MQCETHPEAQAFLTQALEQMKQKRSVFDLGSVLIKPVQRILKYPLLLSELMKVQFNSKHIFKEIHVIIMCTCML